jgi:hypothetical protein
MEEGMTSRFPKQSVLRMVTLSMFAASLVSCGGDGDGTAPPTTDPLDITAANSDTLSHATAAALFAFGSASSAIPADAGSTPSVQAASLSARQTGSLGWLPQRLIDTLLQAESTDRASAARRSERALAVTTSAPAACTISGTATTSIDDRDNDGVLSLGDLVTIVFDNCQDLPSEVLKGSATVSITRIGATTLPSFGARMNLSQLSQEATDGRHGLAVNGNLVLDYEQTSATAERARLTADGAVSIAAHTHTGYSDTVTLLTGFEQLSDYETLSGMTISNATGILQSAAAGNGIVAVSTPQSLQIADTDRYPTSGSVKIAGLGSVVLTALSSTAVQIDLDAEGDGSYESRRQETWDWLF